MGDVPRKSLVLKLKAWRIQLWTVQSSSWLFSQKSKVNYKYLTKPKKRYTIRVSVLLRHRWRISSVG